MIDMLRFTQAKSDQLNAADLPVPLTVRIERVETFDRTEQPALLHLEGRTGRPWKPCKGMIRLLCAVWGPDGDLWRGRSATLFNDPEVRWANEPSGGIRVSAVSDIKSTVKIAVPIARNKSKLYTVAPLAVTPPSTDALLSALASLGLTLEALDAVTPEGTPRPSASTGDRRAKLAAWLQSPAAAERIAAARAHLTPSTQDSP